jgi:uncharacterized repeat protein (TIGR01451 family)
MAPLRPLLALALVAGLAGAGTASASYNADLAVSNSPKIDGDQTVGSTATYTIYVADNGPDTVADATFQDHLGAAESLVYLSTTQGTCDMTADSCDLGATAPGAPVTIQVRVKFTQTGDNAHSYEVSGADTTDPDPNNNIGGVEWNVEQPQAAPTNTPMVETGFASFAQAHLDVDGQVAPYGAGTWWFEYGKTKSYGSKTSIHTVSAQGTKKVKDTLDGLAMDTTYHYRLVLEAGGKTYRGKDATGTTWGKQKYADLRLKAVKRGATSTSYTGYFKDADLLDAPHACRGGVTVEVYTTSNVNIMLRKTRMNEHTCSFKITIPLGSSNARKYGPKGTVLVQAFFDGSYAISHVGTSADHL